MNWPGEIRSDWSMYIAIKLGLEKSMSVTVSDDVLVTLKSDGIEMAFKN